MVQAPFRRSCLDVVSNLMYAVPKDCGLLNASVNQVLAEMYATYYDLPLITANMLSTNRTFDHIAGSYALVPKEAFYTHHLLFQDVHQ